MGDFVSGKFDKDGGISYQFNNRNYYSADDWMLMESAGAVFFPLGSTRFMSYIIPYSERGSGYWAWDGSYGTVFMGKEFSASLITDEERSSGYYVRLVKTSL